MARAGLDDNNRLRSRAGLAADDRNIAWTRRHSEYSARRGASAVRLADSQQLFPVRRKPSGDRPRFVKGRDGSLTRRREGSSHKPTPTDP